MLMLYALEIARELYRIARAGMAVKLVGWLGSDLKFLIERHFSNVLVKAEMWWYLMSSSACWMFEGAEVLRKRSRMVWKEQRMFSACI